MKKAFIVLLLTLFFLFSCSEGKNFKDPEKVAGGQSGMSGGQVKILTGKIEEKVENVGDDLKSFQEKTLDNCLDEFKGLDFIFLHKNTCYALGYYSEMQPISYFYLYADNKKYKIGEKEDFERQHINLLNLDFEKDKKEFIKKYNLPENYLVFNYYLYPDIIGKYIEVLNYLDVKKLPSYFLNYAYTSDDDDFLELRVKNDIGEFNKKYSPKIDTSKLKDIKISKLYQIIKKELEKNI